MRDVKAFNREVRQAIGFQLYKVQNGFEPSDWKPMPTIGSGVREIRIHAEGECRVIYVAHFAKAVYVLHAFAKKTQRTSRNDVALVCERLKQVLRVRKGDQ